jgi:hypothetical protein
MWVATEGRIHRDDKGNLVQSLNPMEHWQEKIRRVRQYLRGWAKHTSGQYKKGKKEILNTLDSLDKKVETMPLDANELGLKQYLNNRLAARLREEDLVYSSHAQGFGLVPCCIFLPSLFDSIFDRSAPPWPKLVSD